MFYIYELGVYKNVRIAEVTHYLVVALFFSLAIARLGNRCENR